MLQMREFMLDSEPRAYRAGEIVFERNEPGASLFAVADGSLLVEVDPNDPSKTVPIARGSIVGEVGLISGRKRGATVRTAEGAIVIEIPRNAALKLMATNSAAKREITRIATERMLLADVRLGHRPTISRSCSKPPRSRRSAPARRSSTRATRATTSSSSARARWWSRRAIGGKPVFLSYLPAGSYVGEMALIDGGRRTATVRAAIKSEVIKLNGDAFRRLLARQARAARADSRQDMSIAPGD